MPIWMRPQLRPIHFFKGRVAHGYFIVSAAAGLFVDPAPVLANYGLENLRFLMPLNPADSLYGRPSIVALILCVP